MGMGANQDDRSQAGRKAMAGPRSGNAHRGAGGRAGGGKRAGVQTPSSQAGKRETTGRKTTKTSVSAPRTGTKRADGRATEHPSCNDAWRRDPGGTHGDRRVAQADLWSVQADQELGQEV